MRILRSLWTLAVLSTLVLGHPSAARPEGSASLYPSTYSGVNAARANLDLTGGSALYANTVKASTFLYVFAQSGEYIVVGSSNRANGGDILIYDPQDFGTPGNEQYDTGSTGTPDFSCAAAASPPVKYSGGTLGRLSTRAQELAGPNSADDTVPVSGGFAPCAYQAPSTGIYGVLFTRATSGTGTANGVVSPAGNFTAFTSSVAAWDVTVRADATSTVNLDGRLFTYAFAGMMGANSRSFYSSLFYVTGDGYRYRQQWQGLDPASYVLYSNTFGFLDNGQPLYKDLRGKEQKVTSLPPGVTSQIAQNPIFFSDVTTGGPHDAEVARVLNALSVPLTAPTPIISNVSFVGSVSGTTSTAGVGGTFTFDSADTISYQIVISLDGIDFNPENANNRTLTGIAFTGSHAVAWDGRSNALATFPPGAYSYAVSGRAGEAHFPLVDSENNAWGGPTITRLNGIAAPSTTIYYDDRGYVTRSGVLVGNLNGTLCPTATPPPPVPPFSLAGIDSSLVTGTVSGQGVYARSWGVTIGTINPNNDCTSTNAWGDTKAVDLWTFLTLPAITETLTIVAIIIDVAAAVSAPATATEGSTVQGSFQFANNGTGSAPGVAYSLSLTPGLGVVTFGNLPTGTTASYDNVTGVVTFGGTPLPTTLAGGQSVLGVNGLPLMSFSYTAPATGPVVTTATISTIGTDEVPENNTASVSTGIGDTDVSTSVGAPATAVAGTTVSATFQFANLGAGAAAGVTYIATIGSPGNFPAAVTFGSVPAGITATYDATTGQVTFTGMPTTLVSGQSLLFGFTYTAPASGTVPINTSISTSSVDADAANNAASGTTVITAAPFSDMSVDLAGLPGTAQIGVPYTGSYSCTNSVSATADALGATCGVSGLPAGVVLTGCTISPASAVWTSPATVPIGQTVTCTVAGTPTTAGPVTVTVTTGATNDPNAANNTGTAPIVVAAAPTSDMSVDLAGLPGTAQVGVLYTGSFSCTNSASATADALGATCGVSGLPAGVVLTGCTISPANAAWTSPATVPIGQTVTCTVSGIPTSVGSGTVTGTTGAANDPNGANNTGTAPIVVAAAPTSDMSVDLAGLPGTAQIGVPYTGSYSCTNSASATADALGATCGVSGLPAGVVLTGCTISPASAVWTSPATVPIGQTVTCTVAGTPTTAGPVTVTVTTGATNDPNAANNTGTAPIVVAAAPTSDMSVDLAGLPGTAQIGVPYTGSYSCTNSASATADALGATCAVSGLPAGVVLTGCTVSPSNAAWTSPATVPIGQTVTCTVSGIPTSVGSGTVTGTTGAANDPNGANNTGTAPIVVAAAPTSDMAVTVTGLPAASSPGAVVSGTITCTNIGAESATDAFCGATGLPPGATLICSPPSPQAALAAGLSITCTVSFTTPAAGTVTVTGTTGASNDTNPANNSAVAVIRVVTANDDGPVTLDSAGGTVPVLANDTVGNAVPVVGVDISLPTILDDGGLSGLTFNEAGELVVPSNAAPGLYTVTYQICALNPSTACDTATVQITVGVGAVVPIPVGSPETLAMLALFMLLSAYVHHRWRAARGGP